MKRTSIFPKAVLLVLLLFCVFLYNKNPDLFSLQNLTGEKTASEPAEEPADSDEQNTDKENSEETIMTDKDLFTYEALPDDIIETITGISWQENEYVTLDDLRYVKVKHYDFEGNVKDGELICNKLIAEYLTDIFYELYKAEYPIEKITLIDEYNGDDEASMASNNSSCFNYRTIAGSDKLSMHAYGMAVDINPLYNPYVTTNSAGETNIQPVNAEPYVDREQDFAGKITNTDLCYQLFSAYGFTWGGGWESRKDYQHFEKDLTALQDTE